MYADYEKLVLDDYRRKKSQTILSFTLMHPTAAKIKRECVRLCKGEIQKKDEKVIRDFCEGWDNIKTCLQNIDNCDVDKFKPLSNFLRGDTESTDPKNIHLLAWLINFQDRPFVFGKEYVSIKETQAGVEAPEPSQIAIVDAPPVPEDPPTIATEVNNANTEDHAGADLSDASTGAKGNIVSTEDVVYDGQLHIEKGRKKMRFRKVAMVGVLLAVTGTSGYLWRNSTQQGNGGCMYWAKDHFQPIPCNQKVPNTLVVALDTVRVKNFKRITRPDTITNRAKGSVWYSKIDNEIEFFTADGEHPVVIGRRLKPITDYIIDKYIHPGMTSNQ
jgi:hypothetical protein